MNGDAKSWEARPRPRQKVGGTRKRRAASQSSTTRYQKAECQGPINLQVLPPVQEIWDG